MHSQWHVARIKKECAGFLVWQVKWQADSLDGEWNAWCMKRNEASTPQESDDSNVSDCKPKLPTFQWIRILEVSLKKQFNQRVCVKN